MLGTTHYDTIPLPNGWPRRVRSAVIHAISLAHYSMTATRSWAANSLNARVRLKQENNRLRQELALLGEELRIKDARMEHIPAQRRPHYPPIERLAILELRAARGWSLSQTARRLLVTPATVASWMGRLDEKGPRALVQIRIPVNKFPDFIGYLVRRLKVLCPTMGKGKIAQVLSRAGLHLAPTTVRRLLRDVPRRPPSPAPAATARVVTARYPNHVWFADLSTVPTSLGFWTSWLPFALPQRWPFCWWVAFIVDHYSRRVMGFAVYEQQPTAGAVRTLFERVISWARAKPRHLITDQGQQFVADAFMDWCRRHGIRQRFGAVGKYGSIAVVERLIRTVKQECTRRLLVPLSRRSFRRELSFFFAWYNQRRPHQALGGATPEEIYNSISPACQTPRLEPRRKWPRGSPCAAPAAPVLGRRGTRLELSVIYLAARKHLPIVDLQRAA